MHYTNHPATQLAILPDRGQWQIPREVCRNHKYLPPYSPSNKLESLSNFLVSHVLIHPSIDLGGAAPLLAASELSRT